MSFRISLIALCGTLLGACVPYSGHVTEYRTSYYTETSYGYPGYYRPAYPPAVYYRPERYYVVPRPVYYPPPVRRGYWPPPPHYRPGPPPSLYRPPLPPGPPPGAGQWHGNPRDDYGNRLRNDYGRDRERMNYQQGPRGWGNRGPNNGWR